MENIPVSRPVVLSAEDIAAHVPETFHTPERGTCTWQTLISAPKTATDTFTTGIARCAPGGGRLQPHRHKQAEIYHVIDGSGIVTVEGVEHVVEKGSVVYIPGDAEHGVRNDDSCRDLVWLYVFACKAFGEVEYCFSA